VRTPPLNRGKQSRTLQLHSSGLLKGAGRGEARERDKPRISKTKVSRTCSMCSGREFDLPWQPETATKHAVC
jgi:hypothetical protein